jgi:hypothetical protein
MPTSLSKVDYSALRAYDSKPLEELDVEVMGTITREFNERKLAYIDKRQGKGKKKKKRGRRGSNNSSDKKD